MQDQGIHMHLLQQKVRLSVRNQMICLVCKVVVERSDLVRGFELSKGNYVQITEEELESLEAEANSATSSANSSQSRSSIRSTSRAATISRHRRAPRNRTDSLPKLWRKPAASL